LEGKMPHRQLLHTTAHTQTRAHISIFDLTHDSLSFCLRVGTSGWRRIYTQHISNAPTVAAITTASSPCPTQSATR
jgi:hypothetical protein